jgi:hypothetical protein
MTGSSVPRHGSIGPVNWNDFPVNTTPAALA